MKPVYMHGGNAYIVVGQRPVESFCKNIWRPPQYGVCSNVYELVKM
jgi:hypothetical protein